MFVCWESPRTMEGVSPDFQDVTCCWYLQTYLAWIMRSDGFKWNGSILHPIWGTRALNWDSSIKESLSSHDIMLDLGEWAVLMFKTLEVIILCLPKYFCDSRLFGEFDPAAEHINESSNRAFNFIDWDVPSWCEITETDVVCLSIMTKTKGPCHLSFLLVSIHLRIGGIYSNKLTCIRFARVTFIFLHISCSSTYRSNLIVTDPRHRSSSEAALRLGK